MIELELGRVIGGYRLDAELGRGAMGVVYQARDLALRKDVALKILLPRSGAPDLLRWRVEAWAAGRLEHPHIARVLAGGTHRGLHYLAMELYAGGSLAEEIDRGRVAPIRAATLAMHLARALAHAHERGVLHRDVKPGNLLLDESRQRVHLADFGLARIVDETMRCTTPGEVLGTLCYMSPEQLEGRGDVGPSTDVYAAGVVLYELATGRLPYHSQRLAALARAVLDGRLVPPRAVDPRVPRALDAICQRALARDPAGRYPSARALAEDLERFLAGEPVTARAPGPLQRVRRWASRHRRVLTAVAATALAAAALGWAAQARDRASRLDLAHEEAQWRAAVDLVHTDPDAALARLDHARTPPGRDAEAALARADAWLARGDARLGRGNPPGAREAYQRAIDYGARPGAVRLARLELASGRPAAALALLSPGADRPEGRGCAGLVTVSATGSEGDLDAPSPEALVLMVEAALASQRPDLAHLAVRQLAACVPHTADVALLEARVFHAQGRSADALVALAVALAARQGHAAALTLRIQIRLALRDGDAALADLELLSAWGAPVPPAARAAALLWSGRPDAEPGPSAADSRTRALAAVATGRLPTDPGELASLTPAERARAAAVLDPALPMTGVTSAAAATPSALVARGRARLARGELEQALALARLAALLEDTQTAEPLALLAELDRLRGRVGAARARYAQLLQAAPGCAAERLAAGRLALDAGDPQGALVLMDGQAMSAPRRDRAAFERIAALALLALGKATDARARLAPLLALDPLDGEAARVDALALARLGRLEEARAARAGLAARAQAAGDRRAAIRREARQAAHDGNFGRAIERASELVRGDGDADEAEALYLRATCRLRAMNPAQLELALADLVGALELDARLRLQVDRALGRLVAFAPRELVLGAVSTLTRGSLSAGEDATAGADAYALSGELHRALWRSPTARPDDPRRALEGYERALALLPTHRLARWGRARFSIEAEDLEAAARDLEQLDRDGPPAWDTALLRAALAGRRGDLAAQERHLADARATGLPGEPDEDWPAALGVIPSDR